MESLIPILEKYPVYRSEVAELLGLILPTSPTSTLQVIEIVDGNQENEQKNVFSDTKNSKYAESSNCLDDNSIDNQTDLPTTNKASKDVDVTWYNSISGEVNAGSEKRYFRVLWNNKQNQHQVGLKKSESAKRWSKDTNPTTQPLIDAVWQEFKAGKPAEFFLQKLYEAAEEVGGKFTGSLCNLGTSDPFHLNESFGVFHILNEDIEVGHSDDSWWFIRPGHNKVYCSGNIHQFTELLKGLKTDIVLEAQRSSARAPQHKTAAITKIETVETNPTQKTSSKPSDCWYTPPEIVELVEKVLGKIDLDPCSDDGKHIPATTHYTITEDGLNQQWQGKVFINPPYSCPGKWIEKLLSEIDYSRVTEAIALLPASTDTKWFTPLWNQPICFWKGRIKFLDTNYQPKLPARQSHCLVYWGENADKFNEVFSKYGEVKTSTNSQPTEVETTIPIIKKIEPLVSEKWVLEAIDNSQVMLYKTDDKNSSDWVKITDLYESQGLFFISHETAFSNYAKTIEEAVERAAWWFEQEIIDSLDDFIDILNGYNTDLIATRNNSTTAYIHQNKELFGTVFFKDDEKLELPEREKQLLRDTYSIDIDNLIEDIQSQGEINPNDYLMGIGK
ncbi:MAG: hypothetical protein F6K15_30420, partial [Okeania sp. SIO2B3]|nr:hypothetical protein [Okeania sp. SIO2B3]